MDGCTPVPRTRTHKGERGPLSLSHSRLMLRRRLIASVGKPAPGEVVRHLCENDSTAPNGFVCGNLTHVMFAPQAVNVKDQYGDLGKRDTPAQADLMRKIQPNTKATMAERSDPCPRCGKVRLRWCRAVVNGKLCKSCVKKF